MGVGKGKEPMDRRKAEPMDGSVGTVDRGLGMGGDMGLDHGTTAEKNMLD